MGATWFHLREQLRRQKEQTAQKAQKAHKAQHSGKKEVRRQVSQHEHAGKADHEAQRKLETAAQAAAEAAHLKLQGEEQAKKHVAKRSEQVHSVTTHMKKPAWAIPEDPMEDRLNDDHCVEPVPYRKTDYAGAFGPEKIMCCHTVRQVISDVNYRCTVECNDAHPCNKAMTETYCPQYLAAYGKMESILCKARPTSTTTTTTTTTTMSVCVDMQHSPDPCRCGSLETVCEENQICRWGHSACQHVLPKCSHMQPSESYPCACGPELEECSEGQICDEATSTCQAAATPAPMQPSTDFGWCVEMCEGKLAQTLDSAKCDNVESVLSAHCESFCSDLHDMGALRPPEEHEQYAKN